MSAPAQCAALVRQRQRQHVGQQGIDANAAGVEAINPPLHLRQRNAGDSEIALHLAQHRPMHLLDIGQQSGLMGVRQRQRRRLPGLALECRLSQHHMTGRHQHHDPATLRHSRQLTTAFGQIEAGGKAAARLADAAPAHIGHRIIVQRDKQDGVRHRLPFPSVEPTSADRNT